MCIHPTRASSSTLSGSSLHISISVCWPKLQDSYLIMLRTKFLSIMTYISISESWRVLAIKFVSLKTKILNLKWICGLWLVTWPPRAKSPLSEAAHVLKCPRTSVTCNTTVEVKNDSDALAWASFSPRGWVFSFFFLFCWSSHFQKFPHHVYILHSIQLAFLVNLPLKFHRNAASPQPL